ncbi:hypothetical protein GOQ30_08470 [Flavobacterium sp. TP390]|uniref:Uncharacterized protein n=1 Tax=Flavobacterium profundi TaxID=1774945 RepID=A0A6I4ILG8_9FLAO|nr:hypothetical protein [Flavobacterium profundi]MVO09192.1 hypothetical protein [Flavobacterium profundi]
MMGLQAIIDQQLKKYQKWDFLVFMLLTLLSVLNGQTTVFYLMYFFWWNELIRLIVDRLYFKKNPNAINEDWQSTGFMGGLFSMGIYWVFLIVFFGFIAVSDNREIILTNMEIVFFQNWFFNLNLIFVLFERIYLHQKQQPLTIYFGAFNPNMIVLHVSIIVGGLILFFLVKRFPETFTPENQWGSVIIVFPFLLLKMLNQKLSSDNHNLK